MVIGKTPVPSASYHFSYGADKVNDGFLTTRVTFHKTRVNSIEHG